MLSPVEGGVGDLNEGKVNGQVSSVVGKKSAVLPLSHASFLSLRVTLYGVRNPVSSRCGKKNETP